MERLLFHFFKQMNLLSSMSLTRSSLSIGFHRTAFHSHFAVVSFVPSQAVSLFHWLRSLLVQKKDGGARVAFKPRCRAPKLNSIGRHLWLPQLPQPLKSMAVLDHVRINFSEILCLLKSQQKKLGTYTCVLSLYHLKISWVTWKQKRDRNVVPK